MTGEIVCDLCPTTGNPRNSEGAFLTLHDGEILFVYSRFSGGGADDAAADLYAMRSCDGGRSFGRPSLLIACRDDAAKNIMSVSLMHMLNRDIGLFYLIRKDETQMQLVLRRSRNLGHTWSPPISCMNQAGFFVVNNDRVLRLRSGRIVVPAALHRKTEEDYDARSEALFYLSDDDGLHFRKATGKGVMPYTGACHSGLQEPGVVELASGVLWAWARTDLGRQYEMMSVDAGETWTCAEPSRFTSPLSPLSMKRLSGDELAAVWNPIPLYNGRSDRNDQGVWTGGRTPLVIAISRNGGRRFSEPVVIEDDPQSGYCYCAIHETKEALLLAYCAGSTEDGGCLARTRLRRIDKREMDMWREQ